MMRRMVFFSKLYPQTVFAEVTFGQIGEENRTENMKTSAIEQMKFPPRSPFGFSGDYLHHRKMVGETPHRVTER